MFNPILGAGGGRAGMAATDNDEEDKKRTAFLDQVASLTDDAHELSADLQKLRDEQ